MSLNATDNDGSGSLRCLFFGWRVDFARTDSDIRRNKIDSIFIVKINTLNDRKM